MDLIAGLILFAAGGAWLAARQRAAGAALAFGVIGTVLFCSTPLGAGLPRAVGGLMRGTASVGGQLVDGPPSPAPHPATAPGERTAKTVRGRE